MHTLQSIMWPCLQSLHLNMPFCVEHLTHKAVARRGPSWRRILSKHEFRRSSHSNSLDWCANCQNWNKMNLGSCVPLLYWHVSVYSWSELQGQLQGGLEVMNPQVEGWLGVLRAVTALLQARRYIDVLVPKFGSFHCLNAEQKSQLTHRPPNFGWCPFAYVWVGTEEDKLVLHFVD